MSFHDQLKNKIVAREDAFRIINGQRLKGRKIIFTNGCFDILHPGHVDYLTQARDLGNFLVLGLNTDSSVKRLKGNERPVNNEGDRALLLASLLCVDAVCLFEEDTPLSIIKAINPDVLVKGGDYTKETIVGAAEVEANGGKVVIVPFVSGYSTTDTLRQIKQL
mgnify:CR=1 FL=1